MFSNIMIISDYLIDSFILTSLSRVKCADAIKLIFILPCLNLN